MTDPAKKIREIYLMRRKAVLALCTAYAGKVLDKFHSEQPDALAATGEYWSNQTGTAVKTVFSKSFIEGESIGFFLSHAVEYGVYLELANSRRNEALRPLIEEFFPAFERDLRSLYAD